MTLINTSSKNNSTVPQSSTNTLFITMVTAVATLGGLLFGYDTAVISGAIGYIRDYFELDPTAEGFAAASILLGCVLGAGFAGLLSLNFGRKKSLMFAAFLFLVASIGTFIPVTYWQLISARFLGGIGVGIASMVSPMYIAEIAPANIRGKLVSYNQLAIVGGILISFFVNYLINRPEDPQWCIETGWRYMFLAMAVPSLLFFVLLFFVPESPRWLALKNRENEALKVLSTINGNETGNKIINEIKESIQDEQKKVHGSIWVKGIFLSVIVGSLLSIFQQITGINVILYYAPEIFKNMGSDSNSAFLQTVLVGVINVLFTFIAIFTVDKFGRKPLLIIGSAGMAIGMLGVALTAYMQMLGIGALIFILIFIASFALSWGPIVWVLVSEIFPNTVRSKAMSIAIVAQWVFNFIVSQTFPMMMRSQSLNDSFNGSFPFILYGLMGILALVFVWKMVPETKGKTLEEMENVWVK